MKKIVILMISLLSLSAVAQERYILDYSVSVEQKLKQSGKLIKKSKYSPHLVAQLTKAEAKALKAQPDLVMSINAKPSRPSSPTVQEVPWGIIRVGAQNLNAKGLGVKVCIVDTGISNSHPDLSVISGENFVVQKGRINPSNWNDDNGHGSHVAGTVAAKDNSQGVVGVAPLASLIAVKVLDSRGNGYLSDIADGVYSCVRQGSHIINMSLGGNGDPSLDSPLKQAINYAVTNGIKVVVAAGNEGQNINMKVPAGYSNVIAVAASDIYDNIASWSNYGLSSKDYTAPGVNIKSTWKGTGYNTISGTSMASPHVAGIFALLYETQSAPVSEVLGHGVSEEGAGLLNADLSIP